MVTSIHGKPTIELIPGGVVFDGRHWIGQLPADEFRATMKAPERIECKFSNHVPWRNVLIYDSMGIYALEDLDERRIVDLGIELIPECASFPTRCSFAGRLLLNGKLLTPGMKMRELPLKGDLNFVKGIGSSLKCVHDNGYVGLDLRRPKLTGGRRMREPVLVSVTHSFLKE